MIRVFIPVVLLTCSLDLPAFEPIDGNGHDHTAMQYDQAAVDSGTKQFSFRFPQMTLIDHRNRPVPLAQLFGSGEEVVFAFFFTHCVSVCTTLTETLKSLQPLLPEGTRIAMISIDPETDTPDMLAAYVESHRIDDRNWYLLTGDLPEIVALQKSFESYRGNKMNHSVSLFLKRSGSDRITEIRHDFVSIPGLMHRG